MEKHSPSPLFLFWRYHLNNERLSETRNNIQSVILRPMRLCICCYNFCCVLYQGRRLQQKSSRGHEQDSKMSRREHRKHGQGVYEKEILLAATSDISRYQEKGRDRMVKRQHNERTRDCDKRKTLQTETNRAKP